MLVQTVHGNFEGYTREEVERAIMASKMQGRSGHPSDATLKKEVSHNSPSSIFHNSPLNIWAISSLPKRKMDQGMAGGGLTRLHTNTMTTDRGE